MLTVSVDPASLRRLEQNIRLLASAGGMTVRDVVLEQARLFQREVVEALPPKSRQRSRELAARDVRRAFVIIRRQFMNVRSSKASDILWLQATRAALIGVLRQNVYRTYDLKTLLPVYRRSLASGPLKPTVTMRGRQKIIVHQKPAVTEHGARHLVNAIYQRFGRLKASFAKGWRELQLTRRLADWIARHVGTAKGATEIAETDDDGVVTFRSWAWGNAHPHAARAIRAALMRRIGATRARVRDLWSGYATRRVKFRVRPGGRRMFR